MRNIRSALKCNSVTMSASLLLRGLRLGVSCIVTCEKTSAAAIAGEKKTRSILKRRSKKVRYLASR